MPKSRKVPSKKIDLIDIDFPPTLKRSSDPFGSVGDTTKGSRRKQGVQNFSDYQPENTHKRFDQMVDQTIYIIKMEVQVSDNFGSGFKLWFKDVPNARDTYTAAVYGQYPVEQLEHLWESSNHGTRISLDSPVKATIRKAGNSYKFE